MPVGDEVAALGEGARLQLAGVGAQPHGADHLLDAEEVLELVDDLVSLAGQSDERSHMGFRVSLQNLIFLLTSVVR